MPTLTRPDAVHVIDLGEDENRFGPDWLTAFDQALDKILTDPAPLVVTATGKFFSNGLDLDWLGQHPEEFASYVERVQALLAPLLTLPVPTVAAISGHAFGAGAMLAIACDWRVMREDRGFFCFPEVDIAIPFTDGMAALIQSKLTARAAIDSMTTGRRFAGWEAAGAEIVDATAPQQRLLDDATALVAPLAGKPTDTLGRIKATMFAPVVAALTDGGTR